MTGWRATLSRWTILCFAVRALLPVGFMPEFRAGDDPGLHFVICSSDGAIASKLTPTNAPDGSTGTPASSHCVFSGLAQLAPPDFAAGALSAPLVSADQLRVPRFAIDHSPHIGPQLGARAPPSF